MGVEKTLVLQQAVYTYEHPHHVNFSTKNSKKEKTKQKRIFKNDKNKINESPQLHTPQSKLAKAHNTDYYCTPLKNPRPIKVQTIHNQLYIN